MCRISRHLSLAGSLFLATALVSSAAAQTDVSMHGFITGEAAQAWQKWATAMQAMLDRDEDAAEDAFGELLELDPSPFRIALLADHTIRRTAMGGAVLLFEQDYDLDDLDDNGEKVAELLMTGREQMNQADDGWYFCQIGRFDVANANFQALLQQDPDPVALLEFADRVPRRRDVLVQLMDNPTVGEAVRQILDVLEEGERLIKADPTRIKRNIERLGGPPRGFENALEALKESGEYAIPFIVEYLRDPAQSELLQPLIRALPAIDRPALNPLVLALRMPDNATKQYIIDALGQIGYAQAVPYLIALRADKQTPDTVKRNIDEALADIRAHGARFPQDLSAAEAFYALAEDYYAGRPSLAADPRLDTANVWYWRDNLLQNVEVPTAIFNEVMCMRCCEESLRLNATAKAPLALWLAANFRRVAQLEPGQDDATRPENYPPPEYFAQSAGAEYNLMALARAIDNNEPAVALGAIHALDQTAGPASLIRDAHGRLPLAEALSFPDRMVRIQAALTLAGARPQEAFHNYQNLMPVLTEALLLHGGERNALVIDPDEASLNATAAVLRSMGYQVISDANLFSGLDKVRSQMPGLDVVVLASDMSEPALLPGLEQMRSEFRFAAIPAIVIAKKGDVELVRDLVRADHRVAQVPTQPKPIDFNKTITLVSRAIGVEPITEDRGAQLALDAARVLRDLALTNNPIYDVADAEAGLLEAIQTEREDLRLMVAEVLGYLGSSAAQQAVADIALDANVAESMRVKMFSALAQAAKRRSNQLPSDTIAQIVKVAESDENLTIREAASEALGALNVPGEPASRIIRNQYRG